MTAPTTTAAAQQYLAEVERELADLPADERAELLDELAMHLSAVQEEPDERSLAERLGSAASYAAELRSAAGLPPRSDVPSDGGATWLRNAATTIGTSAAARELRAFLPELRPAWWVLRGYLVVAVPSLREVNGGRDFPIPAPMGSHLAGVVLVALAVTASVAIGRRKVPRPAAIGLVVLNLLLIVGALNLVADTHNRLARTEFVGATPSFVAGALVSPNGPVTNIYPYAADGTPLDGVLLYDQDGRPLTTEQQQWWPDNCQRVLAQPRAADGVPVPMSFPQQYVLDPTGTTTDGMPVGPGQCQSLARPTVPLPVFPKAAPSPKAAPRPKTAATPKAAASPSPR